MNKAARSTGSATTTITHSPAHALGEFLRLMRNRLSPDTGTTRKRRRAPGLRREEVAVRAGISVTWYTWLEQGRDVRVSRSTVRAIGAALELDDAQRSHLEQLATLLDDTLGRDTLSTIVPPTVQQLVDGLLPHAAYAINGVWDVLYANVAATALLGDFSTQAGVTDNVVRRLFLDEQWRERFTEWPSVSESAVAQFRAATASRILDPTFQQFVARMNSDSAEFASLWAQHNLAFAPSMLKKFLHPTRGVIELSYHSLTPDDAPSDIRVILYTALK